MKRNIYFPKGWGIYIPYSGPALELRSTDLDIFKEVKERLDHKHGKLLTWKFDIKPLGIYGAQQALRRLHANNMIFKFAKQMHTQSDRPEYIRWWIWGDYDRSESVTGGDDTPTPVYIVF